jgi:hypothetical protein
MIKWTSVYRKLQTLLDKPGDSYFSGPRFIRVQQRPTEYRAVSTVTEIMQDLVPGTGPCSRRKQETQCERHQRSDSHVQFHAHTCLSGQPNRPIGGSGEESRCLPQSIRVQRTRSPRGSETCLLARVLEAGIRHARLNAGEVPITSEELRQRNVSGWVVVVRRTVIRVYLIGRVNIRHYKIPLRKPQDAAKVNVGRSHVWAVRLRSR